MNTTELQYLSILQDLLDNGVSIYNDRTKTNCITLINKSITYSKDDFPVLTTRKTFWKSAIAEMIGYIRGYTSAADFRNIGTKTWDANANYNVAWLNNPNRAGVDDMGQVYGAVGNNWNHNQLSIFEIINMLLLRNDNRGLIWSFWNPDKFEFGCLRPCMYQHQFSLLGNKLFLTSTQRSCDVPLGLVFNMVQVWFLLYLISTLTNLEFGQAQHNIVNAHFYDNQLSGVKEQLQRVPVDKSQYGVQFKFKDDVLNMIKDSYSLNLKDRMKLIENYLMKDIDVNHFELLNYDLVGATELENKFPFTV